MKTDQDQSWTWLELVSTYRFWALVFALALLNLSSFWVSTLTQIEIRLWDMSLSALQTYMSGVRFISILVGALSVAYFSRNRLKLTMVTFSILFMLAALFYLFFGGSVGFSAIMIMIFVTSVSITGISLCVTIIIFQARPDIRSFILLLVIVFLFPVLLQFFLDVGILGRIGWTRELLSWIIPLAGAGAVILLLPLKSGFFTEKKKFKIVPMSASKTTPMLVFLKCFFIPFYMYFWMYRIQNILRSIAPEMSLPTGKGAVCIMLFAPYLFPAFMWEVRKYLKELSENEGLLDDKSETLMGVVTFFLPVVGPALLQSDINAVSRNLEKT